MLNFIALVLAITIIFIIAPQTPIENIVLRQFFETGLFTNYRKAKEFVILLTWGLILVFFLLLYVLNFKG